MIFKELSIFMTLLDITLKNIYVEACHQIVTSEDTFTSLKSEKNHGKVVDVEQGESVKLFCHFRDTSASKEPKNWYYIKKEPHYSIEKLTERQLHNKNMSVSSDHVLIIKNFNASVHSGIYSCENPKAYPSKTAIITYVLEGVYATRVQPYTGIFKDWIYYKEEIIIPVNKQFENPKREPFVTFKKLYYFSFRVKTNWGPWSKCKNFNNYKSQRNKNGICHLRVVPNIDNTLKNTSSLKINRDVNRLYTTENCDVPCRSITLGKHLPEISTLVRFIPDYVATDPCTSKHEQRTLRNFPGGINTSWDSEYQSSTMVQIPEGGQRILSCPESVLKSKVEWLKDGELLNSSFRYNIVKNENEPALTIDSFNSLFILRATKNEEGNYTCIVDYRKKYKYDVRVYYKSGLLNDDFFRYSIYLGFVLLLTTTCYCAGICVAWHERASFSDPLNLNNKKKQYQHLQSVDSEK